MTTELLRERQSWTLQQKIDHTLGVIDQFYNRLNGNVYVSFSGGKDSTVLLDLCRVIDKNIKAVFCNTGNEYPDIIRFVRGLKDQGYNIEIIRPLMTPKQVIEMYGFPVLSKELCQKINVVRDNPTSKTAIRAMSKTCVRESDGHIAHNRFCIPEKYKYLIHEDYRVSDKCCHILKKDPFRNFENETGLSPIIGTMASESVTRQEAYKKQGACNAFKEDGKSRNVSLPLSIWLEEDVFEYIRTRNLPISEIYHRGGLKRTGCAFCGFGCQSRNDNRFEVLRSLYPKWFDICMRYENSGHTYREVLEPIMAANNKSLPE